MRSFCRNGVQIYTRSGLTWANMRRRCKPNGGYQKQRPTYINCSLSTNFNNFQFFADWYQKQIGYGLNGYHLDKDILVPNNKIYSEDTCVMVPANLNAFLKRYQKLRTGYPQGITLHKATGRYRVRVGRGDANSVAYLGLFYDLEDAKLAYKKAKEAQAIAWYKRLIEGEFIVDPRVIERLRTWTFDEF